ncbi:hypothetical protein SEF58_09515 [Neomoorella humiferrea]|uniref:hypothetical protein n=1 Tax=Neomoorella humiferrea TaxID=676965 RepID=UPI003D910540
MQPIESLACTPEEVQLSKFSLLYDVLARQKLLSINFGGGEAIFIVYEMRQLGKKKMVAEAQAVPGKA